MTTPPSVPTISLLGIVIKDNGVFITDASHATNYNSTVRAFRYDGVEAEPSRVEGWFKLAKVPEVVEKVIPATAKTTGWKLKAGFVPSEKLPATLEPFPSWEDSPYEGVCECYERVTETVPERRERVEFKLHVIAERDGAWAPIKADFPLNPEYGLLDRLTIIHPVLLPERPCRLSVERSFEIIYAHIKSNLNPKVATMKEYHSLGCLSVDKLIPCDPVPYTTQVGTKRRPRTETRYQMSRSFQIYETARPYSGASPYSGHTLCEPFIGTSYEDLQANIKTFLDELMRVLNEPVKDCPHCKGRGVITSS